MMWNAFTKCALKRRRRHPLVSFEFSYNCAIAETKWLTTELWVMRAWGTLVGRFMVPAAEFYSEEKDLSALTIAGATNSRSDTLTFSAAALSLPQSRGVRGMEC